MRQDGEDHEGTEGQDAHGGPNQIRSVLLLMFSRLKIVQQSAPAANVTVFELDHRHGCSQRVIVRQCGGDSVVARRGSRSSEEGSGSDTDPSPGERR